LALLEKDIRALSPRVFGLFKKTAPSQYKDSFFKINFRNELFQEVEAHSRAAGEDPFRKIRLLPRDLLPTSYRERVAQEGMA